MHQYQQQQRRNRMAIYSMGWLVLVCAVGEPVFSLVSYPIHWTSKIVSLAVSDVVVPLIWLTIYGIGAMALIWVLLFLVELSCNGCRKSSSPIVQYIERPHRCGFKYNYHMRTELHSPEGDVLASRVADADAAGVTLRLTEAEQAVHGNLVAVLQRHVTHLMHIVYGPGDAKIALVSSTIRDYDDGGGGTGDVIQPRLTLMAQARRILRYTQRDTLNQLISGTYERIRDRQQNPHQHESDDVGQAILDESQTYGRKPSRVEFIDERLYSSGHKVVTHAIRSQKQL